MQTIKVEITIRELEEALERWEQAGCPSDTLIAIVRVGDTDDMTKLVRLCVP